MTHATLASRARTDTIRELTRRIEAEYAEMPGLCLTLPQALRLWAIDRETCQTVFERLIDRRVLKITKDGRFVRCS
jgi:hypothetical protein